VKCPDSFIGYLVHGTSYRTEPRHSFISQDVFDGEPFEHGFVPAFVDRVELEDFVLVAFPVATTAVELVQVAIKKKIVVDVA
jgi:hypothetical protein